MSNNTGLMLLCETAVEPFLELNNATYNADEECKKANKLCAARFPSIPPLLTVHV